MDGMRLSALRLPFSVAHDLGPKTGSPLFGIMRFVVVSKTRMRNGIAGTNLHLSFRGARFREPGIHNPGASKIVLHRPWLWIPALAKARPE
jgi:hypothetical protein